MPRIVSCLVMPVLCFFFAFQAMGSIIPKSELKDRLDRNYQEIDSYSLVLEFIDYGLSLRIWQQGENWRQEWFADFPDGQEVVAVAVGQDSSTLLSLGSDRVTPPITGMLFQEGTWWDLAGLDFDLQSYHFFHGRPALAVGSAVAGEPKPHLWMDNEEMVPLRMIFSINEGNLDLVWLDYKNIGNYKLPHKMMLLGTGLEISCSLEWKSINSIHGGNLFSSKYLGRSFSGTVLNPPGIVEDFYRIQTGLY